MTKVDIIDTLIQIAEYLDDHADVIDSDEGELRPNRAMRLKCDVDEVIAALERS